MPNRVGADSGSGGGVGERVEARGCVHERVLRPGKSARFAEPVSAPRGGGNDNDDVEITLDVREDSVVVRSVRPVVAGGEDPGPGVTLEKRSSSSYGHSVLRIASTRVKQVSQELRRIASFNRRGGGPSRIDRSKPVATHALEGLKFISGTDGAAGWTAAESFFDRKAKNGRLPRSKFGECIGMKEAAFAGELFDALARRRNIAGDSINKAELREFWDQISDISFDSRLQTFLDM